MPAFFKLSSNNLSIITIVLKRKHALSHILLFFHFQFTTSKGMTELVIFHTLIFLLLPRTGSIFSSFSAFLYSVCHGSQLFFRTSKTYHFFSVIIIKFLLSCCPHSTAFSSFPFAQILTSSAKYRLTLNTSNYNYRLLVPVLAFPIFQFFRFAFEISSGPVLHAHLSNFSIHIPCTSHIPGSFVFCPLSQFSALYNHPPCLDHLSSSFSKNSLVLILTSSTLQNCACSQEFALLAMALRLHSPQLNLLTVSFLTVLALWNWVQTKALFYFISKQKQANLGIMKSVMLTILSMLNNWKQRIKKGY